MINHHTKVKGDLGVLKAQLDLFQKGWLVLTPQTEHAPFDLVVWKDGLCKTVQVKYREVTKTGNIVVPFSSSWADKNGTHKKAFNKEYIDILCIYCPDTDKCYYIDPMKFKTGITLRVTQSKNNQTSNVNNAEEFLSF